MRHVLLGLIFIPFVAFTQPVIDGDISDASYTTLATSTPGRDSFGPDNDIGEIKYFADGTNIYLGITGELNSNNNIVLFFDFSGYNGRPADTDLNPGSLYSGFVGVFNKSLGSGLDGAEMDMETDFALAFNEGTTSTNLYVDAARYGTLDMINNTVAGNISSQTGTSGSIDVGTCFNSGNVNMTIAYQNDYNSNINHGIEMQIPISAFAGVDNTQSLRLFAIITNDLGFMSNETIPGDTGGSGNLGNDFNLNDIPGQDFFTSTFLLPVSFQNISVTRVQKGHLLSFSTATETNNDYFQIERLSADKAGSTDSRSWEKLGTIAGAGTTQQEQQYRFLDEAPLPGLNYYRVKQVDYDGSFSYSAIVSALWEGKVQIHLFPNPADDLLQISGLPTTDGPITIEIIDMAGRIMLRQNWNESAIDVAQLADGVYSLRISSAAGVIDHQRLFIH